MRGYWLRDVSLLVCLQLIIADAVSKARVQFVVKSISDVADSTRPDHFMKELIAGFDCDVVVVDQQNIGQAAKGTFCNGYDVIVVSSAVDSHTGISDKLKPCTVPVVILGGTHLFWHFGLITTDIGTSTAGEYLDIAPACAPVYGGNCEGLDASLSGRIKVFETLSRVPVVSINSFGSNLPYILSHTPTNLDGANKVDGIWSTYYGQVVIKNGLGDYKGTSGVNGQGLHGFDWKSDYELWGDFYNQYDAQYGWFKWNFTSSYDEFTGTWNYYDNPGGPGSWIGIRIAASETVMFYYKKNDTLADNSQAKGDRIVAFPFYHYNHPEPVLTADGISLFRASIEFGFPNLSPTSTTASSTPTLSTTSSTALITDTTTTSQLGVSFVGEMVIICSNAAELVDEPNIKEVMTSLLAELYKDIGILKSYIKDVRVNLKKSRRASQLRRMDDSGEVDVQWKIDIPPTSDGQAVVKVYAEKFDSKTLSEVTVTVNTFLNSDALKGQYSGEVKWLYVVPEEQATEEVPTKSDEGSQLVVVLSVVAGIVSFILLVAVLFLAWRRTKGSAASALVKRRKGKPLVDCNVDSLLTPPDKITAKDGDDLLSLSANIAATYEANLAKTTNKVCVTYAHGQRDGDVDGIGPGLYFAMAVAKVLNYHGVPCLLDKILDIDESRAFFTSQLTKRAECSVLIIVQTKTLYEDLDCLRDIYVAQQSKLKLLPLRFEEHLPAPSESWPEITREDLEGMLMVSEVQANFCKLNSTPSPPYTVCNQPNALFETAHDLQRSLDITPDDKKLEQQISPESENIPRVISGENLHESDLDTLPFLPASLQLEEEISQARSNSNKEQGSSSTRKNISDDKESGSRSRHGSDVSSKREKREKKRSKESPYRERHSAPSSGVKKARSDIEARTLTKSKNLEALRRARSDTDSERSKRSDKGGMKTKSASATMSMKSKHESSSLATRSAPLSSMKPKHASAPAPSSLMV